MLVRDLRRAVRRSGGVACLILALAITACERAAPPENDGTLTVSVQRATSWVRNFNPFSVEETPRWPTIAGIHEPLMVFNSVKSEYVPWLGVSYDWLDDNTTLRFGLREGVHWSDGESFDANDVVFTFDLLGKYPRADERHVWSFLKHVRAVGTHTVDLVFDRVHVPGFDDVVIQPIVPEHVWNSVADPMTHANANPVGTGPFTEVLVFENEVYELGRNPRYWQEGVPALDALRFPAFETNEESNLELIYGGVDWAGDFIPAIERVFVERDPEHNHYWFPLTGGGIFLYANTTRPPFDDARMRKAMSLSIDRQTMVDVAMFRYTRPADVTGLTDSYAAWLDSSAVHRGDWVDLDRGRARALLDETGWDPQSSDASDASVRNFELLCVKGWSDWQRAADLIADGLAQIGITIDVRAVDFASWNRRVSDGDFDLTIGWSLDGASPYHFYLGLMSSATVLPLGQAASTNWHRYSSETADAIFSRFESASDPAAQRSLANELQHVFVEEAPAIPLFPGPSWATYSTRRVTGFPSPTDPYADPSPNKYLRGEVLLVLTKLQPKAVTMPE